MVSTRPAWPSGAISSQKVHGTFRPDYSWRSVESFSWACLLRKGDLAFSRCFWADLEGRARTVIGSHCNGRYYPGVKVSAFYIGIGLCVRCQQSDCDKCPLLDHSLTCRCLNVEQR